MATPPTKAQSMLLFVVFPIAVMAGVVILLAVPDPSPRLAPITVMLGLIVLIALVMRATVWRNNR